MKKTLSLLLILTLFLNLFTSISYASSEKWYFVVTAYYSPLPNQKKYLTGDYESEKRLNWQWISWASWKWVFSWMLAAPWKYSFWTKIYLEWLGVWVVEDRGWAIVSAWNRGYRNDRIDVWMWYWDEWLARALYWWKRTIAWSIVSNNSKVDLDYKKIPSPSWATSWLKSKSDIFSIWLWKNNSWDQVKKLQELDIFNKSISTTEEIKKLQEVLVELWLYSSSITWEYDKDTIDAIYYFQVSKDIVSSAYDLWAGTFWPKTREALENEYSLYLDKKEEERLEQIRLEEEKKKEEQRKKDLEEKYKKLEELSYKQAKEKIDLIEWVKLWEVSPRVRDFQILLKNLWYFDYDDTAIFWELTKKSLISYQLDKKIIASKNELWAWIFWPKTRENIILDLKQKYLQELALKEEINLEEIVAIILEKI